MAAQDGLVRIGIVSSIKAGEKQARVYFPDMNNMVSDWLYVLQHAGGGVSVSSSGAHTHSGAVPSDGSHNHSASAQSWMPKVNDRVLVLYLPGWNTDGFILGGIM